METVLLKNVTITGKGEYGIAASSCQYNPAFPQYIRITDISDDGRYMPSPCVSISPSEYPTFNRYFLHEGDIVFARTGASTGRNYYYNPKDGNLVFAGFLIRFSIDPVKINPQYIKYYCQTQKYCDWVVRTSTGSTRENLNAQDYANLEIPLKTPEEQQHIVDILGSIDEKIENNELLIQKIEEKVLLEYDRINSLEPLSEIVMSDCFDITIGKTPPRKEAHWFTKNSTDVKWLSISDLGKSSVFCFDTSERITPEGISKYNVKVVPKNTVVLSFKLTVGKVAITGCDMATNEAIAHFNSSNHCLLEYLYCYLKRYNFDTLGNTSSIATAVNSKTIKAMHFFIPDDTKLENFHHKTLPLFENIRQLLIENQKLNELKQLYLKKFFG